MGRWMCSGLLFVMTGMCAGCEVEMEMEVEMEVDLWRQSVGQGRCVVIWEASAVRPLMLRWKLSSQNRSVLFQNVSKLLMKPNPHAEQKSDNH